MMRLTSELVISALLRRIFSDGGFAAVERKGAAQAGALFLRQRHRDGSQSLFTPAPQSLIGEDTPDRRFECRLSGADGDAVDAVIARELRFDPDLWVVELECEDLARYVTVV